MASQGSSGRTSPDEFVERLREVSAANASGRKQLLRRFGAFVQEAAQAVGTGQSGQRTDAGALLARWLDFNLESYTLVNVQGLALLNGLLSAAAWHAGASDRIATFRPARRAGHNTLRDREPLRSATRRRIPVYRPNFQDGGVASGLARQF